MQTNKGPAEVYKALACSLVSIQGPVHALHVTHIVQAHTKNAKEGTSIGSKVASEGKGNWTGTDTGGSGDRASLLVPGWGFWGRLLQKKAKKGTETSRAKRASRELLFEFVLIDSKAGGVPASKAQEICEKNDMYLLTHIPASKEHEISWNMLIIWHFKHFNQVHLTRSSSFPRLKDVCPRLLHQRRGLQSKRNLEILHWQLSRAWKIYAPSPAYCCTLDDFLSKIVHCVEQGDGLEATQCQQVYLLVFTLLCQGNMHNK